MIIKLIGCGLIIGAGILTSFELLKPYRNKIKLLEEGEYLFRLMESEIRFHHEILPKLFYELSLKTQTRWKVFFYICISNY